MVALDPYGFPAPDAPATTGFWSRWSVLFLWLSADVVVGMCSGVFAGLAWNSPDDPQYIGLLSSPWWGFGAAGTFVAAVLAAARVRPLFQVLLSGLVAGLAWIALPTVWFVALVIREMVHPG